MRFKKFIATITAAVCILSVCVACSKDNTQNDTTDPGNNITENNNEKNDLTDSMDELKDDVKDTADNIKDNITGATDSDGNTMGTTNADGAAN